MRIAAFARLGLLLLGACHVAPSYAIDCRTASGQLALMSARVVVGVPQSPADLPLSSTRLPFRAASELFRVAQKVRVDGRNSVTGEVTESNEGDDEGNPMGSL